MLTILRGSWRWVRPRIDRLPLHAGAILLLAFALMEALQATFRRYTADGIHFQGWTSEILMQSVSVRELRTAPLESLWYLHVQPPVHNAIRAFFAAFHNESSWAELVRSVDRDLGHAWALAAAALTALVDAWLRGLGLPRILAALLALGWLLHPANLAYATLLDGMMLSALLTTWILYELWRLGGGREGSLVRLGVAVAAAYFTRSVYQWPFVFLILVSLILLRVSWRRLALFASAMAIVIGLYSIKQAYLFGTVATSTFQGMNLVSSIGAACRPTDVAPAVRRHLPAAPVLTQRYKSDGSVNFNHVDQLDIERNLMACFRRNLRERSFESLAAVYGSNFFLFIKPSSSFWANPIVDRAPWRRVFDRIFSGGILIWISLAAAVSTYWQARRRPSTALALLLPAAYVFIACIFGERGDNMRFKFLLEPAIYVWWAAQLCFVVRAAFALAYRRAVK